MDNDRRYGVVMFDDMDDPGSGWAAVADPDPRRIVAKRIAGHNELPNDTIWWSNIKYASFFGGKNEAWRNPTLRHDKYLVVAQADVLREWGYDPQAVDADFVCTFCSQVFDRVMRIAWSILSDVNPKMRVEDAFQGKTLREDMRPLVPKLEYPKLEAAEAMKTGQAWQEFTPTGMRGPKGGKLVTLRRPRLAYAMTMLQTPLPWGPYEYMSRGDLRSKCKDRIAYVRDMGAPSMVEVTVNNMQQDVAPVYGFGSAISKDKKVPRSWVSGLEFEILSRFAEVDVKAVYRAEKYWALVPDMNEAVRSFLSDKFTEYSWSAGIVAETLWRTVSLGEEKGKGPKGEPSAQTSWQGLYVRAADKTHLFQVSMRLNELGYSVQSYGLGWVRSSVAEEDVNNFIRDGLSMGLLPYLSDVPENVFDGQFAWPAEDKKAKPLAQFTLQKQSKLLWGLDRAPTLPRADRGDYIKKLMNRMNSGG